MYLSLVCTYHWFFELLLSKDSGTLWFVICAFFERSSRYSLYSLVKTVITQLLVRCVHGMIKMTCQSLAPATLLRKRLRHKCFLVHFVKFLQLFYRTPPGECFWHLYHHSPCRIYCFDRLKKFHVRKIHLTGCLIISLLQKGHFMITQEKNPINLKILL